MEEKGNKAPVVSGFPSPGPQGEHVFNLYRVTSPKTVISWELNENIGLMSQRTLGAGY